MLQVKQFDPEKKLIEWIFDKEKIDLDPSYQRRSDIWSPKTKALLINSVLNQYDIPKIYLANFSSLKTPLQESQKPYAVIDGKQRLTTFFQFYENGLDLDGTDIQLGNERLSLSGKRYSDLKNDYPELARRFDNYTPTMMSVVSDDYEGIREMFIRLNLNVSISGPERRNAMGGPLPAIIRELAVHDFLRDKSRFPNNRGQDLNAVAKLLLMETKDKITSTKRTDLDRFVKDGEKIKPSDLKNASRQVRSNLDRMAAIFVSRDPLLGSQAQIPIFYYFVKSHPKVKGEDIRNFLLSFETLRARVRKQVRERAEGKETKISDQSIMTFNTYLRSPDDRTKQETMLSTLNTHFEKFLKRQ